MLELLSALARVRETAVLVTHDTRLGSLRRPCAGLCATVKLVAPVLESAPLGLMVSLSTLLLFYRRHLRVQPLRELMAIFGVAAGVALLFAVQIANGSVAGSFERLVARSRRSRHDGSLLANANGLRPRHARERRSHAGRGGGRAVARSAGHAGRPARAVGP